MECFCGRESIYHEISDKRSQTKMPFFLILMETEKASPFTFFTLFIELTEFRDVSELQSHIISCYIC